MKVHGPNKDFVSNSKHMQWDNLRTKLCAMICPTCSQEQMTLWGISARLRTFSLISWSGGWSGPKWVTGKSAVCRPVKAEHSALRLPLCARHNFYWLPLFPNYMEPVIKHLFYWA